MCRLSKESNSDAGTQSIDWLELKHAVDEEQSLTGKIHFVWHYISGKASLDSFRTFKMLASVIFSRNCLFHFKIGTYINDKIWYAPPYLSCFYQLVHFLIGEGKIALTGDLFGNP